MTKYFNFKATLVLGAMLILPLSQATAMTKDEYKASKSRISADYKSAKASCAPMAGNAKDICVEEAKAKEKVAKAELEHGYTGKAKDQNKILVAKADSTYKVAKERCDDRSGNDKDVCVKEAKATQTKSLADAKMSQQVGTARTDANQDKRDADYKVAVEKCDAMAGDAKSSCVAQAKTRFGKN